MPNKNHIPRKLYSYVPSVCLEAGIRPGGWDPEDQVVPAFDPKRKSPDLVKSCFGFGESRVLVEIVDEFKKYFTPRRTGPQNKSQGVYGTRRYVPPYAIRLI
jgi:hypothetical protein